MSTEDGKEEVAKDLVAFYGLQNLILNVNFEVLYRKWIQNERIEHFCQHEVDLETYVLIGEMSLAGTQSAITPGVHLTLKIAGLKN